jgi:16S rRNA (guanine527-N7)-methyltransferase
MKVIYKDINKNLQNALEDPRFATYYSYLVEQNKVMNLTNITDEKEVYEKHFYDSVILTDILETSNKSILDIGAGAGFPSVPIKILDNSMSVTIVDGLNKRIKFLSNLVNNLALNSISLIHGRAEELDKSLEFDLVTARAVARLNILVELAIPYVKTGGYFVAYKSTKYESELLEAEKGISILGGQIESIYNYRINDEIVHTLILIKKVKRTPKDYPRQFSKIKKAPL